MIRSLSFQELVRAGGQFVLRDLRGAVSRTVSSTGTVAAIAVFDALGVQRSGTGALASGVIRDTYGNANEDGMTAFLAGRVPTAQPGDPILPAECEAKLTTCLAGAVATHSACLAWAKKKWEACSLQCFKFWWSPKLMAACMLKCKLIGAAIVATCWATYTFAVKWCWDSYYECLLKKVGPKPVSGVAG